MTIDQRIYSTATAAGLPAALAALIVAQAKHETGGYTSPEFLYCNNAFGYKYVGQALATGDCLLSPEDDYYSSYNSIEDSTREVVNWIFRRQREGVFPADLSSIVTPEQYAQLLKNGGYYGDTVSNYAAGLSRYWVATAAAGGTLFIILLALGILAYKKKIV